MHDLKTFKKLLVLNGIEIKSYDGAFLTTKKGDIWGMVDDEFYKNGEKIERKQLKLEFPKKLA